MFGWLVYERIISLALKKVQLTFLTLLLLNLLVWPKSYLSYLFGLSVSFETWRCSVKGEFAVLPLSEKRISAKFSLSVFNFEEYSTWFEGPCSMTTLNHVKYSSKLSTDKRTLHWFIFPSGAKSSCHPWHNTIKSQKWLKGHVSN
jgi:hypothetical protein